MMHAEMRFMLGCQACQGAMLTQAQCPPAVPDAMPMGFAGGLACPGAVTSRGGGFALGGGAASSDAAGCHTGAGDSLAFPLPCSQDGPLPASVSPLVTGGPLPLPSQAVLADDPEEPPPSPESPPCAPASPRRSLSPNAAATAVHAALHRRHLQLQVSAGRGGLRLDDGDDDGG